MVFIVPSVYDTNKYKKNHIHSFPSYRWLGPLLPTVLLPTPNAGRFLRWPSTAPQLLLPTVLCKGVSQPLGAEVYLGKLSGCSLMVVISENTWVGRLWGESSRRGNHHFASGSSHLFPHYGNTATSGREAAATKQPLQ